MKRHDSTSYFPIKEHPYYLSLKKKNKNIYENYIVKSFYQYSKPTGSWYGFVHLYKKIKHEGFDFLLNPIVIKRIEGKWVCLHGRHRICILYKIFGPHVLLKVLNDKIIHIREYDGIYENLLKILL
jgi:hypothetical protein